MDDIRELTMEQVAARIGQPDFHVYDCNGKARWQRSHVATAVNVNPHLFAEGDLGASKTDTLVFYCSGPG